MLLTDQLSTYSQLPTTLDNLNRISSKLESLPYLTSKLGYKFIWVNWSAWGFAATIYAVLFGTFTIKPWGLVQKNGFKINNSVQTKLRNKFEIIPLVHHPKTTNNLKKLELKKRLDSLQLFLTEYVVDVQYLDEIYK
ncbi:hypothetical protein F8M41_024950 [Gigaspora margarita]|uniref:Uncharacterized protein n=1 Tax=Gigaspora margarita TaxID=4874 RepID=A0A8H4B0C5_GIGMA|nr:hypothetical protein F8M41_024950 [Gigaspora margarita]